MVRRAGRLAFGVVCGLLAGCSGAPDEAASSQDLTSRETPFDHVAIGFTVTPNRALFVGTASASDRCAVSVAFVTEDGVLYDASSVAGPYRAGETASGEVRIRRYERLDQISVRVSCRDADGEDQVRAGWSRIDPAHLHGNISSATTTIALGEGNGAPAAATDLAASTTSSRAATDVDRGNCAGDEPNRLFVRVRVDLNKKHGLLEAPYGNDYEAALAIDGDRLKRTFRPKADAFSDYWSAYCPAADTDAIHLELGLREKDVLLDDTYAPVGKDIKVGETTAFAHVDDSGSMKFRSVVAVRR